MLPSTLKSLALAPLLLSAVSARAAQPSDTESATTSGKAQPSSAGNQDLDSVIEDSELLSLHRDLCEIESISDSEREVGEFLAEYLESHDFTVEKQEVPHDGDGDSDEPRFNIYAYSGDEAEVDVILTAHIDVVPPYIPYKLTANDTTNKREDILISGRGTVDVKSGVAAQTIAAIQYLEKNKDAKIGLLFVVSEETTGAGMRAFSESDFNPDPTPFKGIIFAEPTDAKLATGHKGTFGFTVNVTGEAGHSGYPWLFDSAVSAALPILERLDVLDNITEEEGGLLRNEKFGRSTLNIGTIDAGTASNVIPQSAVAECLIRIAEGTPEDAEKIVRKAVKEVCEEQDINEDRVELTFRIEEANSPIDLEADVEGFESEVMHYGTDISNLEIKGDAEVKRFLYGPGSIMVAHGIDEGLTVGELENSVEAYIRLIDYTLE